MWVELGTSFNLLVVLQGLDEASIFVVTCAGIGTDILNPCVTLNVGGDLLGLLLFAMKDSAVAVESSFIFAIFDANKASVAPGFPLSLESPTAIAERAEDRSGHLIIVDAIVYTHRLAR